MQCSNISSLSASTSNISRIVTPLLLLHDIPDGRLHPQLRVQAVGELEAPRQRLRVLAVGRRVHEDALQVERRRLRRLVGRDLHGEEAVVGPVFGVERAVAAADDDL